MPFLKKYSEMDFEIKVEINAQKQLNIASN